MREHTQAIQWKDSTSRHKHTHTHQRSTDMKNTTIHTPLQSVGMDTEQDIDTGNNQRK